MTKFKAQTFSDGDVLSNGNISNMSNNDDANYSVLYAQPRGIIFHRRGYNPYDLTSTNIYTDSSATHTNSAGTPSRRSVKVGTATIPVEENRKYYIEFSASTVGGMSKSNAPALLISVDGAFKVGNVHHLPYDVGTPGPSATSIRVWYIHEVRDVDSVGTIDIGFHIKQMFNKASTDSILRLSCLGPTSVNNFYLKVEDWGAILSPELEV